MAGVDGIDIKFQQILVVNPKIPYKMMINKALNSHKFHGPALRYEVGTSLLSDDYVWLTGPWLPGDWNDITIFRQFLIHELDDDERIEADDGYIGEAPDKVICPGSAENIGNAERCAMRARAQGRIEVFNRHIKFFGCLRKPFISTGTSAQKVEKHGFMTYSCVIIKQIAMELGVNSMYKLGDDYK